MVNDDEGSFGSKQLCTTFCTDLKTQTEKCGHIINKSHGRIIRVVAVVDVVGSGAVEVVAAVAVAVTV